MASLPQSKETSYLISSGLPSFESPLLYSEYHCQQTPTSPPSLPASTDFDGHLPEIHGRESWWLAPAVHLQQPSTILYSCSPSERLSAENCGDPMFSRYGVSHHSFSEMARESWNGKFGHLSTCTKGMDDNLMSELARGYLSEGTSLTEMMRNTSSIIAVNVPASPSNGFSHSSPLIGKHFDYNLALDYPNVGITIDPSKGGLAIQNVSLLAAQSPLCSQPVEQISADKIANFTYFNKQLSLLPLLEDEITQGPAAASLLMRDGEILKTSLDSHSMLHGDPSGNIGTPSSTSNSPSALRNRQETMNAVIIDPHARAYSSMATEEEPKYPSCRKPSLLSALAEVDCSEGIAKQCASIDDSDMSMGLDISSSYERDNGWETSTHNTPSKKKKKRRSKSDVVQLLDAKDVGGEEGQDKRHKGDDLVIEDDLDRKQEQSNDSDESMHVSIKEGSKPLEAEKRDYIHVRARRGQATDSHSLAERIRREKISERMKFLQDLVPGCSKITGKAVMLDEIINYIQSLQRQVEFLSMKLAAMKPRVEQILQPCASSHQPSIFSAENPLLFKPMQQAPVVSHPPVDIQTLCRSDPSSTIPASTGTQLASEETYGEATPPQASQAWDDELQNVVQYRNLMQGNRPIPPLTPPNYQGLQQPINGQIKPEF